MVESLESTCRLSLDENHNVKTLDFSAIPVPQTLNPIDMFDMTPDVNLQAVDMHCDETNHSCFTCTVPADPIDITHTRGIFDMDSAMANSPRMSNVVSGDAERSALDLSLMHSITGPLYIQQCTKSHRC